LGLLIGFVPTEVAKEFARKFAKDTVVGLFKWLRGKKPDEVKKVEMTKWKLDLAEKVDCECQRLQSLWRFGNQVGWTNSPVHCDKGDIERILVRKRHIQQ